MSGGSVGVGLEVGGKVLVEVTGNGVGRAVGDKGVLVGGGVGEAITGTVTGAWTATAPQAVIKNAARVSITPAAGLSRTGKFLIIKGSMIALIGLDVQYFCELKAIWSNYRLCSCRE